MFRKESMRKLNFSILAACSFLFLSGCQKDDICAEETATTPLLQIEFFDVESPETLKVVPGLTIIAVGEEEPLLGPNTINNVSIPLRTDQNFTEYRFITNSGTDTENVDIIRFDYLPTPDYVNRACGFKINFLDLTVSRTPDEDNWVLSETVNIEDIENETATHISFNH